MASQPTFVIPVYAPPARIICLVVSLTLALFSTLVYAQDTAPSSAIKFGIYSGGACSDPELLWIYTPNISIVIQDDYVAMEEIEADSRSIIHGWQRFNSKISDETYSYFMRMSKDGDVEYIEWHPGPNNIEEPPEDRWASILPASKEELNEYWALTIYTRCESIPFLSPLSMLHSEVAAFLFSLEPAISVCRSGHSACIQQIFAVADVHRDGALSKAEWARLIRLAIYFGMILDQGISTDKLGAAQAAGLFTSPLAASAIVSSYDYDDDGKTSLGELTRDMRGRSALAIPEIESVGPGMRTELKQAINRLSNLLKLLPDLQ